MEKPSRALQTLNLVAAILMLAAIGLVFFYAPEELVMGEVQRIFYFHVSSAWVGFLAFFVTVVAGVLYLRSGQPFWDRVGSASVEVGLLFSISAGVAGAIWARPIWNTWWTWDPRLTTYTIMALIYIAYLMLRQGIEDPDRRARFAAVYGIVGFISVPITYMSIRWWRTIHPVVIGGRRQGPIRHDLAHAGDVLVLAVRVHRALLLFSVQPAAAVAARRARGAAQSRDDGCLKEDQMPALLLIDPTPDTVNYLILGYIFLIGLPVLYVLSWYARQRSLKRDLETIEMLAADERKRGAQAGGRDRPGRADHPGRQVERAVGAFTCTCGVGR